MARGRLGNHHDPTFDKRLLGMVDHDVASGRPVALGEPLRVRRAKDRLGPTATIGREDLPPHLDLVDVLVPAAAAEPAPELRADVDATQTTRRLRCGALTHPLEDVLDGRVPRDGLGNLKAGADQSVRGPVERLPGNLAQAGREGGAVRAAAPREACGGQGGCEGEGEGGAVHEGLTRLGSSTTSVSTARPRVPSSRPIHKLS